MIIQPTRRWHAAPAMLVLLGVTALLSSTLAIVVAEFTSTLDTVGWQAAWIACALTILGCILLPFVPAPAREMRPPVVWRVALFLLAIPSLLLGLPFSLYLMGIPVFLAGVFGITVAAGYAPGKPVLGANTGICLGVAGFYWVWAFNDTSSSDGLVAMALTAVGIGSALALVRLRRRSPPAQAMGNDHPRP